VFKNFIIHSNLVQASLLFCVLFFYSSAFAEEFKLDSLHHRNLKGVTINGHGLQNARAALPVQLFSEKEIGLLNAVNVIDVARQFSGITVKDYGGIGGLKTVSLRGMGAQHTGVSYDGVMLSDIQSGQIDLGRISLENISEISLTNGQPNDIFQTARMFSSAGVLCLKTKLSDYNENKTFSGKFTAKTGSFGLLNLGAFLTQNAGRKWAFNLSTDALFANGKYKFIEHYGSTSNFAETLTRTNGDVKSIRTEVNALYRIRPKENISLKSNYFYSERGLPGGIIFYNAYSSQRLLDKTFFSQIHYENKVSQKFQHQYFAKFNSTFNNYRDFFPTVTDNYLQKEYYLSSSFLFKPIQSLFISASADWWYNDLTIDSNQNFEHFVYPTRQTGLVNIATKYVTERFTLGANVLYTHTFEKVRVGTASSDRNKLSPTANISYKLFDDKELRIRAFYKNIFRVPTFNDLYYQDMGNHNLRPENANQYNVGITYLETEIPFLSELLFSMDGYYNQVNDKIIATPRDLFHWTMVNKGKVEIKGLDLSLKLGVKVGKTDVIILKSNYTYQQALDATPESANLGEQIPYTPFHSGSGSVSYGHGLWEGGYNMIFSGIRWNGQNIKANKLEGYMEQSIFASCTYKRLKLTGEIINLLDNQYEVMKFYPMPGRNFRITLSLKVGN